MITYRPSPISSIVSITVTCVAADGTTASQTVSTRLRVIVVSVVVVVVVVVVVISGGGSDVRGLPLGLLRGGGGGGGGGKGSGWQWESRRPGHHPYTFHGCCGAVRGGRDLIRMLYDEGGGEGGECGGGGGGCCCGICRDHRPARTQLDGRRLLVGGGTVHFLGRRRCFVGVAAGSDDGAGDGGVVEQSVVVVVVSAVVVVVLVVQRVLRGQTSLFHGTSQQRRRQTGGKEKRSVAGNRGIHFFTHISRVVSFRVSLLR